MNEVNDQILSENSLKYKEWNFKSMKTKILNEKQKEKYLNDLEIMVLPEMIFNSNLNYEYKKDDKYFNLNFNSKDALLYGKKEYLFLKKSDLIKEIKVSYEWNKKK
jgi:hypothetical protein